MKCLHHNFKGKHCVIYSTWQNSILYLKSRCWNLSYNLCCQLHDQPLDERWPAKETRACIWKRRSLTKLTNCPSRIVERVRHLLFRCRICSCRLHLLLKHWMNDLSIYLSIYLPSQPVTSFGCHCDITNSSHADITNVTWFWYHHDITNFSHADITNVT